MYYYLTSTSDFQARPEIHWCVGRARNNNYEMCPQHCLVPTSEFSARHKHINNSDWPEHASLNSVQRHASCKSPIRTGPTWASVPTWTRENWCWQIRESRSYLYWLLSFLPRDKWKRIFSLQPLDCEPCYCLENVSTHLDKCFLLAEKYFNFCEAQARVRQGKAR